MKQKIACLLTSSLIGCASLNSPPSEAPFPDDFFENPVAYDGLELTLPVYLYDYGHDESYMLCFEPCSAEEASQSPSVLHPLEAGQYAGETGQNSYILDMEFDAICVQGLNCSPHVFFIFQEIRSSEVIVTKSDVLNHPWIKFTRPS